MGLLYDRIETPEHTIIRFSRYLLGLIGIGIIYVGLVLIIRNVWLSLFLSILLIFVISWDMRAVREELVAAQQAGTVTRSGRRMSLRDPLTYAIAKKPAKRPRKPKRKSR